MSDIEMQQAKEHLRAGYYQRDAYKQKRKLLLVLKTGVAGIQHHIDLRSDEGREQLKELVPGTELRLFREPENDYDQWAIAVYTQDDELIGYITRFKNEAIARMMDAGKRFVAFVDEAMDSGDDVGERFSRAQTEDSRLPFSVYLEE